MTQSASSSISQSSRFRFWEVDALRGVAIVMMIIYHQMWNFYFFGAVSFETLISPFWKYFQRATASNFITLVGVSLVISYHAANRQRKARSERKQASRSLPWWHYRRWGWGLIIPSSLIVAVMATPLQQLIAILYLAILAGAWIARIFQRQRSFGNQQVGFGRTLWRGLEIFGWGMVASFSVAVANTGSVDFGVLHLIGFSIVASYPFLHFRWINVGLWIVFNVVGYYLIPARADDLWLVWLGWRPERYTAVDYFPIFPWFGVVLLGIAIGNFAYGPNGRKFVLPDLSHWFPANVLQWLGTRSLFIYLIHQPLLFMLTTLLVQIGFL